MTLQIEQIGSRVWQQPMGLVVSSHMLGDLFPDRLWDLNPPFQRSAVWTLAQKRRWIETLLAGLSLPSIVINRFPIPSPHGLNDIVIDGQQRLRATAEFMRDEFKVRGETYSEQGEAFDRAWRMGSSQCPIILCQFKTMRECAELYVTLLTAGTAHTSAEIAKAKRFIKGLLAEKA